MSNGRIDEAQIKVILSGSQEKRDEYVITTLSELYGQVTSIAQHCRYCDENDEVPERDEEGRRQHWLMWMVGAGLVNKVLLPLAVGAGGVLLTLAITGQLGG